jgi:hypothetical protein
MDIPISGEIRESALELKKRSGLGVPLRLRVRGESAEQFVNWSL